MAASDTRSCMLVAEAATQIVLQKLDILLSRPVCIECLSMRASMEDAKAKLATIQDFISTQYRPSKTTEWSGRLLQAMNYAEEFIDKFQLRKACKRHEALHMAAWPLAALVAKCKLRRDLSILVNKMEGLCDEKFLKEAAEHKRKNGPASSSSHPRAPWQGTKLASLTSFWDRYVPIISLYLQDEKKKLMKWMIMQQGGIQGTSIFGRSGTGKAILARWAHSQAKYMDYERRAYVHISAGMDKRQFLFEILKQVEKQAREMKDMDIKEIKAMLSRKLAETKRFLIVLDEVQQSNEPLLRELAMILPFSSQGHLIYTTQDDKIAQYMNTSGTEPIKLEDMDVEGSQRMLAWELHGVPDGGKLSDEEKKILEICPAVPLCISLIGGFLSNAAEHERAALAKERSMMTLLDILQLSCHKLPVHLKPCFIYMALFPVTFPIPTRRLLRLWLADGLLNSHCYDIEGERTRKPEDVGAMFILELAHRNVIYVPSRRKDGSPKTCQMVVPLHEMIRPIAMSVGFLHIHAARKSEGGNDHDPTSQQQQPPAQPRERTKVRWLVEHANIVTVGSRGYPNLNLRHVSSFLSFHQRRGVLTKDVSTFLRKMTSETDYSLLRVLDLEGVYKPSLQGVLPKLVLLRYLGLRSTVLDSIPREVADLHYLETLDIKHTNITSLPSSLEGEELEAPASKLVLCRLDEHPQGLSQQCQCLD
ncbi:probable disease resistance protein RF45 [Eucalyptus grandis]|uniref:probable disease resistance protein RF45 n=1 Tax=Eucalyptus grandis TaxID=71139 RepID=UPI00192EF123|nr:probable disease resistance protein RF45 [Eucalyptus grandis]